MALSSRHIEILLPQSVVAARYFDGVDDTIITGSGSVVGSGAISMFALVRRKSAGVLTNLINGQASDNAFTYGFGMTAADQVAVGLGFTNSGAAGPTFLPSDGWGIIGFTRPAGSAQTVRGHLFKGGAWSHFDYPTTLDNGSSLSGGKFHFSTAFGVVFYEHDLAVAGVWDSNLSDGNIETLDNGWATQNWIDLSPTALWQFDQASTATPVEDEIGDADQISIVGTAVISDGPTSWTYFSGDVRPPTPNITSGPTLNKISSVSGKDQLQFDWQSSEAFQHYKIKVVPATTSPHSAGVLVEQDVTPAAGGSASTTYTATITDDEVIAADPGDGSKILKVFVQDAAGNWSL